MLRASKCSISPFFRHGKCGFRTQLGSKTSRSKSELTEYKISEGTHGFVAMAADDRELKIGLISDSHDCLPKIKETVARLNAEGVELVLHAGDYSAPFVTSYYGGLKARMVGVFGNNDAERTLLRSMFAQKGHEIRGEFAEVKANKLKIALTHGDETDLLQSLSASGAYDVVVYGHTHQAGITEQRSTLVVNPGEVCGYLSDKSTFAILDTVTRKARLIPL